MPHEFDSLWWHSHQIVYCGRHWSRMPAPSSEKWMNRHFRKTLRLFEIVSDLAAGFFFLKNFYNASVVIIWKHKFSNSLKTIIIIDILSVDMPQALQHWSWTLIWCNLHSRRWICNFTNWAKYAKKFTDSISSSLVHWAKIAPLVSSTLTPASFQWAVAWDSCKVQFVHIIHFGNLSVEISLNFPKQQLPFCVLLSIKNRLFSIISAGYLYRHNNGICHGMSFERNRLSSWNTKKKSPPCLAVHLLKQTIKERHLFNIVTKTKQQNDKYKFIVGFVL